LKVKLVFYDWLKTGKSIYIEPSEDGCGLSMGDFHSGSTFDGKIELDADQEKEFEEAIAKGYQPCFWVGKPVNGEDWDDVPF